MVGGGHNGLICAAYLARAGLDTIVVEARPTVGGCASTESIWGVRFNICNCDHTMIRAMPVIDELELADHGLRYLEPESGYVSLFHDGSTPWVNFFDPEQTLEGLAAAYPGEVDGYRRYVADAVPVIELVIEMAKAPTTAPGLARTAMARGSKAAARLLAWSRRSMVDVLSDYFDAWQLIMPAASMGPTVWGVSPTTPGTGLAAALYALRHVVRTGRPVGGSGALPDAVAAAFAAAGGRVQCESRVQRLLVDDERIHGVELAGGQRVTAPVVVAAYDPQRVFVDWLGEAPARARKMAQRWRERPVADGYESKVDAVLTRAPRYRAMDELEARHPGIALDQTTSLVAPSPDELARAHQLRAEGRVDDHPTFMVNVPTVLDPSMAPEGTHVLSLETLFTPYELVGGWPGSSEPQRWLDVWSRLVEPGTLDIERWRAMTPDVYETEFGMHRGYTPSYGGAPLATLVGRSPETSRYRTAIDGLYLTGAATFPGAGIFGAPGRNTAGAVLADLGCGPRR